MPIARTALSAFGLSLSNLLKLRPEDRVLTRDATIGSFKLSSIIGAAKLGRAFEVVHDRDAYEGKRHATQQC